jgi:hypothetical protein
MSFAKHKKLKNIRSHMADSNNVPQEVKQLTEDLESLDKDVRDEAKAEVASPSFDKEYEIAKQNSTGSGNQSSDPNPVNRAPAEESGDQTTFASTQSGDDSDPADYLDMAREVTKNAEANAQQ